MSPWITSLQLEIASRDQTMGRVGRGAQAPGGQAAASLHEVPALVGASPVRLRGAGDPTVRHHRAAGIVSGPAATGLVRRSTVRVVMRRAVTGRPVTAARVRRRIVRAREAVRIAPVRAVRTVEALIAVGLHRQVTVIVTSIGRGWSDLETH